MRSLTRRAEFDRVYRDGRKLVGRSCVIYLMPSDDDAVAVVASRKVGGAVRRNRAKRLLRHMIRAVFFADGAAGAETAASLMAGDGRGEAAPRNGTGLWVVAVARRPILDLDIHALTGEAVRLLADHGLDAPGAPSSSPR